MTDLRNVLARPAVAGAVRVLAVDRVTAEVVPALAAVGIRPILLKGPSIARWLYPSGGRSYGDTDLLVPPADFARAGSVLERPGPKVLREQRFSPPVRQVAADELLQPVDLVVERGGELGPQRRVERWRCGPPAIPEPAP